MSGENSSLKKSPCRAVTGPAAAALCFFVLLAFGVMYARCVFYGLHTPDESFYFTIPYRIFRGDALLIDEWHLTMFSSFLQYLPLAAFIKVTGSTDGIILFFRLLYVISQTAVAVFVFSRMKRYGVFTGLCAALLFFVYVPEYVPSTDYYTMSLAACELIAVILLTSERISVPKSVFIGILSACAVIAQPVGTVLYFIYSGAVLFSAVGKRKAKKRPEGLSPRIWGGVTAGIVLTAAVFATYMLMQAPPAELIKAIPNLFSGYDHVLPFSGGQKTDLFCYHEISIQLFRRNPVTFCASPALAAGLLADRRRTEHRPVWFAAISAYVLFDLCSAFFLARMDAAKMLLFPYVPFTVTLYCYLLTKNRDRRLFCFWCAGLAYVVCLGAVSHALEYVGVIGCVISNTVFPPVAAKLISECRRGSYGNAPAEKRGRLPLWVFSTACAALAAAFIVNNAAFFMMSDRLDASAHWIGETAREKIVEGPLSGITVSSSEKKACDAVSADVRRMTELAPGRFYVEGNIPWTYLMNDAPPGTCSAWYVSKPGGNMPYYEENPLRIPRAVYYPSVWLYLNGTRLRFLSESFPESYFDQYPVFRDYTVIRGEAGYLLIAPEQSP